MSVPWKVETLTNSHRKVLEPLIRENWGGPTIATRGKLLDVRELPGLFVEKDGQPAGYLFYHSQGEDWEVVVLEALKRGQGIGTALLNEVRWLAKDSGGARLWLITTNDNVKAQAFYQRYGFTLCAVHRDGATRVRETLKPSIPLTGEDGIPIRDEWEFELRL